MVPGPGPKNPVEPAGPILLHIYQVIITNHHETTYLKNTLIIQPLQPH